MSKIDVHLEVHNLRELIDRYWEIAYAEGVEGRSQDTEDGKAQWCRHLIEGCLKRLAESAE